MNIVTINAYAGVDRLRIAIGGDVNVGNVVRSEGSVNMSLVDPVLSIECEGVDFSGIHPDILALIGVLAFYPALPTTDEFKLKTNFPVSPAVERALRRPWILPGVCVQGSGETKPYEPKTGPVLSYGGGIDSLAASIMFPDLPLIHETPLPSRKSFYIDVVNEIVESASQNNHVVYDNLRQLFTTWGLPLWVSVYIASLIHQPSSIISGSEMTGTYLLGGIEYKPRYANLWYQVFGIIGVKILPTSFLSEIGNAKLTAAHARFDDAAYCAMINRKDCDKCTKCLRRRLIRAIFEPEALTLVDNFQSSDATVQFLRKRPLYYGDVFIHAVSSHARSTWVTELIADLVEAHGTLGFHDSYNPDTFDHFGFPVDLREKAEICMQAAGLYPFTDEQRQRFESFDQVAAS